MHAIFTPNIYVLISDLRLLNSVSLIANERAEQKSTRVKEGRSNEENQWKNSNCLEREHNVQTGN